MIKGIRFRAYPNKEQQNLIEKTFGCCRFAYNIFLDSKETAHKNGENLNYTDISNKLTQIKKTEEYSFLREPSSVALQQSLRDSERAYTNFFQKRAKRPRFKSKRDKQSFRLLNAGQIRIEGKRINVTKIGLVKIKQSMGIENIKNITIEKTKTGKYFVVVCMEFEPSKKCGKKKIGIDVGIKEFYSDSNGNVVENPKHLEKTSKKLRREQKRLSRKKKGSKNRDKQRLVVARVHEKVTNKRNDFLHKVSSKLISENQVICIEDLNVKGMLHNHKLARAIASVSWSKFFEMLEYKAEWYGAKIIKVPTMYPSSQTCSCCGYKNPLVKNLAIRKWTCPECGTTHDRDVNASINILNKGLEVA